MAVYTGDMFHPPQDRRTTEMVRPLCDCAPELSEQDPPCNFEQARATGSCCSRPHCTRAIRAAVPRAAPGDAVVTHPIITERRSLAAVCNRHAERVVDERLTWAVAVSGQNGRSVPQA